METLLFVSGRGFMLELLPKENARVRNQKHLKITSEFGLSLQRSN